MLIKNENLVNPTMLFMAIKVLHNSHFTDLNVDFKIVSADNTPGPPFGAVIDDASKSCGPRASHLLNPALCLSVFVHGVKQQ